MLFLCAFCAVAENTHSQNARVNIQKNNVTIDEVLDAIESQTDYLFVYNNEVNTHARVSVNARDKEVREVLSTLFDRSDVSYTMEGSNIVLASRTTVPESPVAQQAGKKLSGTVNDATGMPLIGVSVLLKGSATGTITDLDGNFTIEVPGAESVLVFSYIGYAAQEVKVGSQSVLAIRMAEDNQVLGEVVVTALGIKREEKALGYATQTLNPAELTTVKTVDMATGLTGKIAGLNVRNSTEFNESPTLLLRGETPLLVVDGVPYKNLTLNDIAADDIESMSVLKGATASALYGERGGSGAIMITTKRGVAGKGLQVDVNSSSMFAAGFLVMPEVQTSYSSGGGGKYAISDYVWGDKLDIGRTAKQYNPRTYEWEEMPLVSKGKNNLQNFMQTSYVLNNNISVSQQGENGGFRTSLTYVHNKGQYPNTVLNKMTASVGGNIKYGNFDMDAGMTYNRRSYPSDLGQGYGGTGYLYNLVVWQGTEFDIRDYTDYWVKGKEDYQQNWMDTKWYNNPWYIAHEMRNSGDYDLTNGFVNANYQILPWLKATFRSGIDVYSQKKEYIRPIGTVGALKGSYEKYRSAGYSWNNDFLLLANTRIGDFGIDGLVGGTIYYQQNDNMDMWTKNGLSIPGYYSIFASVDPAGVSQGGSKQQTNSLYGKATLSYKSMLFVDVTARNDWSSTLKKSESSYFYPSFAGSWVINETFALPEVISLLKLRGSWTQTKEAPSVYAINSAYAITTNAWDGLNGASYPASISTNGGTYSNIIRDPNILPESSRTYEFGLGSNFFTNRLRFDIAYYNKLYYNRIIPAETSDASGFKYNYINFDEEIVRKGVEISLGGTPVKTADWRWDVNFNWAKDRRYYNKIDANYSADKPWVKKGARYDYISLYDWERAPDGQLIHSGGKLVASKYESLFGYSDPDWFWGLANTVSYKNLTLSFSFDGRVGGMMFNTTNQAMWNSGSHIESDNQWRYDQVVNGLKNYVGKGVTVVSGDVTRDKYGNITGDTRVFAPNQEAVTYESYMISANPYIGTQRSQNFFEQTFIKLRDVSLTYDIPKSVQQKIGLQGASVSFIGQNLWIWTKEFKYSDPDKAKENMNAPSVRYLGANIKFNF